MLSDSQFMSESESKIMFPPSWLGWLGGWMPRVRFAGGPGVICPTR